MAADFIPVNRAKQMGNSLVRAADLTRELRELIDKLSDCSSHQWDTNDYTVLEAQFGLAAGQGANVLSLIAIVNNIFNTSTDITGANRLSQLDEFCARIAGQ